jgi:hypothetical protein
MVTMFSSLREEFAFFEKSLEVRKIVTIVTSSQSEFDRGLSHED